MYLKALKLHGFKSFADPTISRFEPGVTAIVGPNGCGKSNIADGIRWVLGEQSAKALRGGKMHDVIFDGTDSRKPAQLCEVSLLLTECEKQLGSEFHEIEIMRRVHRDGGSEYFFNGQSCRLKDIQKLFMDTGIGRTSYSIMAQGQIDQILSSKPEERRSVFEEAAGITKYKSQRREAMNKLALTEQNLARVSDVIAEVGRQIGSLKRQASKALRYKRISFRLRHLSLAHSAHQHETLATSIAELAEKLTGLRGTAQEHRARLESEQGALAEKKAQRGQFHQRIQDAQQAVFDLKSQREQADNNSSLAQIKRTGLEDRLKSSHDHLAEVEMQMRELSDQVDSGAQDKEKQLSLLGSSDQVFQNRNRELAVAEAELTQLDDELKQTKFTLLQMESAITRLRTDTTSFEVNQETSVQSHDLLVQQIDVARGDQTAADQRAAAVALRLAAARGDRDRLDGEAGAIHETIAGLTGEFREAQRSLQEIDRSLAQRSARLKLLRQLHEKWEGFGLGAKAILQGRLDEALGGTAATAVTEGLQIDPPSGKAVEALLGSAVEAIHVADLPTVRRVLTHLEQQQIGSAVMQIDGMASGPPPVADLPAFLQPAATAVINLSAQHPAAALLEACYLADDLQAFLDYWQSHPDFGFVAVATRKGELVDRRGLVFGGFNKKPENSIVQREIDLRETAKAVADDQQRHQDQKQVIEAIDGRLAEAEKMLEAKRDEVLSATRLVAAIESEERQADQSVTAGGERIEDMQRELTTLEAARNEAQQRFEEARTGLAKAESESETARKRIGQMEVRVVEIRTQRDGKRDTLAQARLELADRRQKVEVLDRGIADMERRREQMAQLLAQRQQEIEVWSEQISSLEHESTAQQARAAQIEETLVVAQEQVDQVRQKLTIVESDIEAVENAQQGLRLASETVQGELSRCEVRHAEIAARATFIAEEVMREYAEELADLDWKQLLWRGDDEPPDMKPLDLEEEELAGNHPEPAADEAGSPARRARRRPREPKGDPTEEDLVALDQTDWAAVKTEIAALRSRLTAMGTVNLVAIEEYAELKQRYDFLQGQSDDLTKARTELLAAIDQINRTSQEQFAITFEQIKKNFKYTFDTLFGGGVAKLELIEEDDILESGVEITAQPPGTKLKSITLLSGGQKTLTAVALLFALYMVKPSPFCLLDELDAPLDESNIGRFTDLLKKFVDASQFIIITHNKRTVAAAAAIYGVTMEERGVSRTVSMKFNHDRGEPEQQPDDRAEAVRDSSVAKV